MHIRDVRHRDDNIFCECHDGRGGHRAIRAEYHTMPCVARGLVGRPRGPML